MLFAIRFVSPWLSLLLVSPSLVSAQEVDPAAVERREALHRGGVDTPLQLYPVRLLGRTDVAAAEALGLVLERQGMPDLALAEAPFDAGDADWAAIPARFAAHVRKAAAPGAAPRAALYAEFLGDPKQGPTEVRFVVVAADGEVVLMDRQLPTDAAFRRTAGRDPDPLGCARLVADRLFTLADWQLVAGGVRDGKFAARWQQKSGLPDRAERAAIEQRLVVLRRDLAIARVAVLPSLWTGTEPADAAQLAAKVAEALGCKAAVGGDTRLTAPATANQQQRLWGLAKALQQTQRQQPLDADYVLVVDAGLAPGGKSGFVDVVVVDRAGAIVLADFQNDQHTAFRQRRPQGLADAEAVAIDRLRTLLR